MTDAARLFDAGWKLLPAWNAPPDAEAEARALAMIRQAAHAGHVPAMVALCDGLDRTDGFAWGVAAARCGDLAALVSALTSGDWPLEAPLGVLAAARAGEPWAQLAVGRVYRLGMCDRHGVNLATQPLAYGWLPAAVDPDVEGLRWLEAAATSGWPPALLYLAVAIEGRDAARALALVARVCASRDAIAARERQFAARLHVRLLERTAAPWAVRWAAHEAMAAEGDMESQTWLADGYRCGEGVPCDLPRARSLYEPAAAAGVVDACRELARMCEQGVGGALDRARAQELYERAAELGGDPFSRRRLAEAFGLAWYAPDGER